MEEFERTVDLAEDVVLYREAIRFDVVATSTIVSFLRCLYLKTFFSVPNEELTKLILSTIRHYRTLTIESTRRRAPRGRIISC